MEEAGSGSGGLADEVITVGGFGDVSGIGQCGQPLVEGGGAHPAACAQIGEGLRLTGFGEGGKDAIVDGLRGGGRQGLALDEFEGECRTALDELEGLPGDAGSGAMFDGQGEAVIGIAAQVEVGVAPGVELGGAAQGLAGAHVAGAFAGVVDEDNGGAVAALQVA